MKRSIFIMFNFITRKNKVDFYKFYSDKSRDLTVVPIAISTPVSDKFLSDDTKFEVGDNSFRLVNYDTRDFSNYVTVKQSSSDITKCYHPKTKCDKSLIICVVVQDRHLSLFNSLKCCPIVLIEEKKFNYHEFEEVIKFTNYTHYPITESDILSGD